MFVEYQRQDDRDPNDQQDTDHTALDITQIKIRGHLLQKVPHTVQRACFKEHPACLTYSTAQCRIFAQFWHQQSDVIAFKVLD